MLWMTKVPQLFQIAESLKVAQLSAHFITAKSVADLNQCFLQLVLCEQEIHKE